MDASRRPARGTVAYATGASISVPSASHALRIFTCSARRSTRATTQPPSFRPRLESTAIRRTSTRSPRTAEIFETGKQGDRTCSPLCQWRHVGLFGGAGVGDGAHPELINNIGLSQHGGLSVFGGRRERTREATDLWRRDDRIGRDPRRLRSSTARERAAGSRLLFGLSGLTMAEYFRERRQDVLLSSTTSSACACGLRGSALLAACRVRSATSRRSRPRWASCRSASLRRTKGSITSVQAIYVHRRRLTDPAPANTCAHLDATTFLALDLGEGIYRPRSRSPASRILHPGVSPTSTYDFATRVQPAAAPTSDLQDIIASWHGRSLRRGQVVVQRARRSSASSRSRSSSPGCSTVARQLRPVEYTIRSFREVLECKARRPALAGFYCRGHLGCARGRRGARAAQRRSPPMGPSGSSSSSVTPEGPVFVASRMASSRQGGGARRPRAIFA